MLSAFMFISCEKDDALNQDAQNLNSESQLDKDIQILPFFEVAKGDSISKGVYREKPEVSEMDTDEVAETADEDLSVLRSTSGSSADELFDEMVSVVDIQARSFNRSTDAPSSYISFPSYRGELATYYKINFDLNRKAGGKYIYFYIGRQFISRELLALRRSEVALRNVTSHSNKKAGDYTAYVTKKMTTALGGFVYDWKKIGTNGCGEHFVADYYSNIYKGTGKQVDLNEGAGGKYVYIFGSTNCKNWDYITSCKVANYTRSEDGYRCTTGDLNDGAGGSFIYLHTKHLTW